MLHIHIFLAAPLGTRPVAQPRADRHQGGVSVRERPHHTRPAADLAVQPLDHIVGVDARPVFAGKVAVGQRFFPTAADQFLDLPLDNFLVQLYNILRHSLLSSFRMVCRDFILPESASHVSFCAIYFTLS